MRWKDVDASCKHACIRGYMQQASQFKTLPENISAPRGYIILICLLINCSVEECAPIAQNHAPGMMGLELRTDSAAL